MALWHDRQREIVAIAAFVVGLEGVTLFGDNLVQSVKASDGVIQHLARTGRQPWGIAAEGANIWVAAQGDDTLDIFRVNKGSRHRRMRTEAEPAGVLYDGSNIWVANSFANTVSKISR